MKLRILRFFNNDECEKLIRHSNCYYLLSPLVFIFRCLLWGIICQIWTTYVCNRNACHRTFTFNLLHLSLIQIYAYTLTVFDPDLCIFSHAFLLFIPLNNYFYSHFLPHSGIPAGVVRTKEPSAREQEVSHHKQETHQAGVSDHCPVLMYRLDVDTFKQNYQGSLFFLHVHII